MFPPRKTEDRGSPRKGVGLTVAFIGGKGESPDAYKDDKPKDEESPREVDPAGDTRRKAVEQLVTALGVDPKGVDIDKVDEALCGFMEAAGEETGEQPDSKDESAESRRPRFATR